MPTFRGDIPNGGGGGAGSGPTPSGAPPPTGAVRIVDAINRITNPLDKPVSPTQSMTDAGTFRGFVGNVLREGTALNLIFKVQLVPLAVNNAIRLVKLAYSYRTEASRLETEVERSLLLDRDARIARAVSEGDDRSLTYSEVLNANGVITQQTI
jgi:hypothetical protein